MWQKAMILIAMIVITACSQSKDSVKRIQANYCSVIKTEEERISILVGLFDDFASSQEMNIDKSSPSSVVYTDKAKATMFILAKHMGPDRSVASIYKIAEESNPMLDESFKQFILGDISKQFEVTPCEEVEGMSTPEIVSN